MSTLAATPAFSTTTPLNALLVGADRLGSIPDVLQQFGIHVAAHVSGRDSNHQRRHASVPAGVGMVILFTDFLGHNVMQSFREAASRAGVSLVCCRRSVCALQQALGRHMAQEKCAGCQACPNKAAPRERRH
ncbi:hypothetical protein FACS1894116_06130 [Betaproteobacteria bacterium]|nr:hypothetical protein FACS1894116_06130 [Betaproteobacteria bacterium]GHT98239.1 hypothetical protein FACS1894154_03200 [Betaproteobacteria bacterium]